MSRDIPNQIIQFAIAPIVQIIVGDLYGFHCIFMEMSQPRGVKCKYFMYYTWQGFTNCHSFQIMLAQLPNGPRFWDTLCQ